jgi:hypothetical protein
VGRDGNADDYDEEKRKTNKRNKIKARRWGRREKRINQPSNLTTKSLQNRRTKRTKNIKPQKTKSNYLKLENNINILALYS